MNEVILSGNCLKWDGKMDGLSARICIGRLDCERELRKKSQGEEASFGIYRFTMVSGN